MSIRPIFVIAITVVSFLLFSFSPSFNFFGAAKHLSMFDEFIKQGQFWNYIKSVGGLTLVVLFASWILTSPTYKIRQEERRLAKEEKKQEKEEKQKKKRKKG